MSRSHRLMPVAALALLLVLLLAPVLMPADSQARTFRQFSPIPQPQQLPDNALPIDRQQPLPNDLVLRGVREILAAWNNGELDDVLAENFINRQKLADTVLTAVPRDADLSLLALRSHTTLRQYQINDRHGAWRVSRVAVVVRLQLTFNDPVTGYQRLPGTSELIIDIREPL